jgi:hypothetical protein
MTVHMQVLSEVAAGAAEGARARSDLFEGFFEDLAEDVRGLLEETMTEIDDAHRRGCGHLPPAMKSYASVGPVPGAPRAETQRARTG